MEQVSLQLAAENAKRRFTSDAGRQCIPDSGGRHSKSPVSECGTSRRRYQQGDGKLTSI